MLRFDNVARIIFVNFCTRFHLYIHIYALVLQQRGLSLLEISTIESVVIATMFLMEVPTGVIADRIGRKWSLMISTLLMMIGELIFLLFWRGFWDSILIAVFTGTGFAFASGAMEALIYDSLPEENRDTHMKRAMGRLGSWGHIAFFIAPLIGSVILGDLAPERVSITIALTVGALLIGVLVSLTLHEPAAHWNAERNSPFTIFRSGFHELRSSRRLLWIMLLTMFTTTFTGSMVTTLGAPYLAQNGVSPFAIGLTLSLGSLIAAFTQRFAHRVEAILGARRTIVLLAILPGIWYMLLAFISGGAAAWLIITFMYGSNDMKYPLFSSYQNRLINSRTRATVLSMMNMSTSLYVAVIAPLYAALATRSLPLAFVTIGVVIIMAALALRVDRLPLVAVEEN
jgi:MFS family permease